MEKTEKYNYHFRPEYGSDKLLLQFINDVENKNFETDLFDAIKEINPKVMGSKDLWMNDEILYFVDSDFGEFILSKDVWGFAFIMAKNNQPCLVKINALLIQNNKFEKIEWSITPIR